MRFLRYRSKIMLYNLAIFTVTMLLVLFAVLQSAFYFTVLGQKEEMLRTVADLNLYIQEKTAGLKSDNERAAYLFSNANDIYNVVINYSSCQIEIFSYDGVLLAYDESNSEPTYMNSEYETCLSRNEPVMSVRRNNGIRQVWVMAPILTKTSAIIGYVGVIMPLTYADSLQWFLFIVIGVCMLAGLALLTLVVAHFSQSITRPIETLTKISGEINKGQYDKRIVYKKNDEIGELTQVYNQMTENINNVIVRLRNERRRLGGVLASLDEGLLALDNDGTVSTSNRYIKTYFDVADPKRIEDFERHGFFMDIFNSLKSGKSNVSEEVEVNGRILLISASPIKGEEGKDESYLFIIRNVTPARTLEKEQRKFISSISHELRTPLTTIIGYTDMLNRRQVQDPELLKNSLNTINREGHRLVRLVDDLLNAHSVENMVFSIHKESLNLDELLRGVVEQMRIKSLQKEIEIVYKAGENLPEIYGDYDRLSQIFINIIHNAIKFSSPGSLIDVVLTEDDNGYLSASIRDYGTGIDPAKKDFIFSAFYRVDEDRARNEGEGGAGLGLYLVKQVVEKHNGRIRVDSELEEGTNITVLLPIKQEDEEEGQ